MIQALAKLLTLAIVLDLAACATMGEVVDQSTKAIEVQPVAREVVPEPEASVYDVSDSASTFLLPPAGTDVIGELRVVVARHEDTLSDLARQYDLGYKEITKANPGVDPWLPGAGTRVVLPTQFILPDAPRVGVVLNVSAMRLFYYPGRKRGKPAVVITHPIGIGQESGDTPLGVGKVIEKTVKPTRRVPASIRAEHARDGELLPNVAPPGPDNPLGEFAMRPSMPGYLIHGANKPYGVGMRLSHGCIQLYPEDIEHIFGQIPVGTPVRIVDQPYLIGRRNGTLYLKAHEPENRGKDKRVNLTAKLGEVIRRGGKPKADIDWNKARGIAKEARGIPIPILTGSPDLVDLLATAHEVPVSLRASSNFKRDFSSRHPTGRYPMIKFAYTRRGFASIMLCSCVAACSTSLEKRPSRPATESGVGKARSARPARNPADIAQEITRALEEKRLTSVQVKVDRDLSVTVTGSVDERAKKEEALRIVRETSGVGSVKDFLSVVRVH